MEGLDGVLAAEAAYEKSLGITPKKDSTASSTTGGTGRKEAGINKDKGTSQWILNGTKTKTR